jgi:hypothetical protein
MQQEVYFQSSHPVASQKLVFRNYSTSTEENQPPDKSDIIPLYYRPEDYAHPELMQTQTQATGINYRPFLTPQWALAIVLSVAVSGTIISDQIVALHSKLQTYTQTQSMTQSISHAQPITTGVCGCK